MPIGTPASRFVLQAIPHRLGPLLMFGALAVPAPDALDPGDLELSHILIGHLNHQPCCEGSVEACTGRIGDEAGQGAQRCCAYVGSNAFLGAPFLRHDLGVAVQGRGAGPC